jgi:catechol 2,3-dioxygenase-like lactoylglutathione lyase family enzyme
MPDKLTGLDHVQIAMPAGEEAAARRFYSGLLGLREVEKPPILAKQGGVWFEGAGFGVHLGVEQDFHPARKAHPCFRVKNLDDLQYSLEAAGIVITPDTDLPDVRRFYAPDPFGNRIEFQQQK